MFERTCELEVPISTILGEFDKNAKIIERELSIQLVNRDDSLKIIGDEFKVEIGLKVINSLAEILGQGEVLNEQNVLYTISSALEGNELNSFLRETVCITHNGRPVKPKTRGQRQYVDVMRHNVITFGIGPAGTGKTYLAVAMAVNALKQKQVGKIILTRPAVEAGEKLGFLPGDLQNKVDPYLRPLYDSLSDILSAEGLSRNLERGIIEVAPLAYMRGRTLDDAYIILDEAQNTTPEQMKMFLTRLGFGSKAIVTGDITQMDIADGKKSGLKEVVKILKNIDGLAFCNLTSKDVVRHPLVQKIIEAYENTKP